MCINPFCSIADSLFAYTRRNESLIHRCHFAAHSHYEQNYLSIQERGEGGNADMEDLKPFCILFRYILETRDLFMSWIDEAVTQLWLLRVVLIVLHTFVILLSFIILQPLAHFVFFFVV